ncbi:hypothetical protein NQZ68_016353 [Dissostichus eleginoides]|nr:hypothetical protein NQZ68_016353 [Dissostichus eleginoides]
MIEQWLSGGFTQETSPLESLLKSPLESPLKSPLESLLKSLLKSPLESLLKSLLKSPLESLLKSPLESLFESPLESPLESPIEPSVKTVSSSRQEGSTGAVKRPPGRADRCSSTGALFRSSLETLDGGSNEAVWPGSRFIPSLPPLITRLWKAYLLSSGPLSPLSEVIRAELSPCWRFSLLHPPQARWRGSTCREPERTLAVIFCH